MSDCRFSKDGLWCSTHKAGVPQSNASECAEILRLNLDRAIREIAAQAMEKRDLRAGLDDAMKTGLDIEQQRDEARAEVERLKKERKILGWICAACGGFGSGDCESIDTGTTLTCADCKGNTVVQLWSLEGYQKDNGTRIRIEKALFALGRFEVQGCPCGARPESPTTHPHVLGCHVEEAIIALEGRGPSNRKCASTTGTANQVTCVKEHGHQPPHFDGRLIEWMP